ncbi:hypothetical protein [Albidovulum inexpectatum]|uniref:hypothetical protein n=1 Tax=Albidovulum inexpectatum TaxID=196587 RepID=UPI001474C4BD|nr:hypothetical protein [Albidovulum inexpectatum]
MVMLTTSLDEQLDGTRRAPPEKTYFGHLFDGGQKSGHPDKLPGCAQEFVTRLSRVLR